MSVVVSVQDVGPCKKQLRIEVPASEVDAEIKSVSRAYGQRAKIPGFRKGKVPEHLVRQRFQKDIEHEVVERLLPKFWRQAQDEQGFDPLLAPDVDEVQDLIPGTPLVFVASVEVRPEIALKSLDGWSLPDPEVEPGTLEIDDAVDELRREVSDWKPVERPASQGDRVKAEIFETRAEGGEGTAPNAQDIDVEVGDKRVWEELSLALVGLSVGQESTFTHHVEHGPGEHGSEEAHSHSHSFRLVVREILERDLPELDDAFAAKVSPEFTTFDDLRQVIVRRLKANKEDARRQQRFRALMDQLRERHPLTLPVGVVQQEVERMLRDEAESLARQGVDPAKAGIDWQRVSEDMQPHAERRVHEKLLLDAVAADQEIAVTPAEFEGTLAVLARAQNTSTSQLRRTLDENGRLEGLRAQLRRDKTVRRLLGEEPPPPASPDSQGE